MIVTEHTYFRYTSHHYGVNTEGSLDEFIEKHLNGRGKLHTVCPSHQGGFLVVIEFTEKRVSYAY